VEVLCEVTVKKKDPIPKRPCNHCEEVYQPNREWQKYCSDACKTAAWVKIHYGEKDSAPVPRPLGNMLLELIEKYRASFLIGGLLDDKYIVSVPEMGDRNRTLEIEGKTPEEAIQKAHIEVTLRARKKEMEKVLIIWNSPS
jgi:predicted RNase H-like HicB family nuclease